ncbi:hypothetical protein C2S53_006048 [Perilla frutescens var. hirtella]|uniref:Sister chromatid cohesion protein PDS5 homolog A n=1 Tax=Perilla frutescens var. hirtella TaxID=608512 RepID=A0AAD4JFB9_PERFH|nr:hypothetical protein C2S53_006048 [Perilla frutescens var. hirtella]
MAEVRKKTQAAKQVLKQIGVQLAAYQTCPDEIIIVELLEKAASALMELKQWDSIKNSVMPPSNSRTRHGILDQRDVSVLAPHPGSSRAVSLTIFRFLLRMFEELNETSGKYFGVRARILEAVDKLQFCLAMLDTGCEDLVLKMFKSFFSVVREDHPRSLINSISSIITNILENVEADPDPLERNTFQLLLDVILRNIIKGEKGAASGSYRLAASVIQNFSEKLKHCICQFLTSCILNRDAVGSPIKESYHEIIVEIYQVAPELLRSVIPYLTDELLTDQVDVRIKVLNLIEKLLVVQGKYGAWEYPCVWKELLNRFSDKSAEVRLNALSCAKALYITNLSGRESLDTLFAAIGDRLLDHDDQVRMEAVNIVCELAKTNLNRISSDLITQVAKRLRDKKVLVRKKAFEKLVELYQVYVSCTRLETHTSLPNESFKEIPCKFLMLCYEKDCQEFRPQRMELVLVDLFPACLSTEEKTEHWISIFSHFKPPHLKALKTILSQKRRLRDGLKDYLNLCRRAKDTGSEETERKIDTLVVKMSSCFPDPAEAKDYFEKLKEVRDDGVFSVLDKFLKEKSVDSDTIEDVYLKELGEQKALSEFFHLLFRKCGLNIFGVEHVRYILDCLSSDDAKEKQQKNNLVQLLLTIINAFPSLLEGSETKFQHLILKREIPFDEQLIEMLAREGCHMPVKLSDMYPFLEKVCLEGTRSQSKVALSAISALADTSEQFIYPQLCKILVDSLQSGQNTPTVLQSLGCLAQYSISTYESQEEVITNYIVEKIFQQNDALASKDLKTSTCCSSCELKVYGLKTIMRSFLPHKNACLGRPLSFLLEIIHQMLQNHQFSAASMRCERDEAFIRLAAAKSVLQLSMKWDLHISPDIFRLTILVAKDPSPAVRRSFTSKLHKLLQNHAVPIRYACAFSFVALDPLEDLRNAALKFLEEFIREYGKRVQIHETMTKEGAATHPACLIVFLIHVLAHDRNFPAPDCRDVKIYTEFMSPLFITVQSLVNGNLVDHNLHLKSYASLYLRSIFNALKKVEDAVNAQMTPKLRLLAEVGLSVLNSLNTKITPLGHTPALVLLPSSLYRNGSSDMREANPYPSIYCKADASFIRSLVSSLKTEVFLANPCPIYCKADASFTKNLVSSLKPDVFLIGSTGTKHSQHSTENSLRPSGTRHSRPSSTSDFTEKLLIDKTEEQVVELQTGQKEQFDTSNCEEDRHKTDDHRELEATPSGHCDSMSKSSIPHDNFVVSCPRNKDAINKTCSILAEPSESPTSSDQVNHVMCKSTQVIETNGGELTSKHIKACSPIEERYFSGIEDSFDSTKSTQQDLDDPQTRNCDKSSSPTASAGVKNLDSFAYDSKEVNLLKKRNLRARKVSQAVKRTKISQETTGTANSEVIDLSGNHTRRSRRLKV